jgi:glycosyltransferase involved in cell wall biosynthesis
MIKKSLVSIYIVNFNYASYLIECIESVLMQTYEQIEVIIIYNGSSDDSHKILKMYENNSNIKILNQKNNSLTQAINLALEVSSGEFILRLDADDYLLPEAIQYLVQALINKPSAVLAYCNYKEINIRGEKIRNVLLNEVSQIYNILDTPTHGACTLFRKRKLIDINGYSENYVCQDGYYAWLHFRSDTEIVFVGKILFCYRRHDKNLTSDTTKILETRSKITRDFCLTQGENPIVVVFIPVKISNGKQTDPLSEINGKKLIDWTLITASQFNFEKIIVVSTNDLNLIKYIKTNWKGVLIHDRLERRVVEDQTYIEPLIDVTEFLVCNINFQYFFILEIDYPFRNYKIIENAIYTACVFDYDSVIGVIDDQDYLYKKSKKGLIRVINDTKVRIERESIFRRQGGFSVLNRDFFISTHKILSKNCGFIIVSQDETFEISQINRIFEKDIKC